MSKKRRVCLSLEDNALCWRIETPRFRQWFAVALGLNADGTSYFHNFLWELPTSAAPNLRDFLEQVALKSEKDPEGKAKEIRRIKIKPWQEEMFHRILEKLQPEGNPRQAHLVDSAPGATIVHEQRLQDYKTPEAKASKEFAELVRFLGSKFSFGNGSMKNKP